MDFFRAAKVKCRRGMSVEMRLIMVSDDELWRQGAMIGNRVPIGAAQDGRISAVVC